MLVSSIKPEGTGVMQKNIDRSEPRRGQSKPYRKGATTVEFAIVGPIVLLLLIGAAILTLGTYRYQQVAYLARVGARYASTHGAQYRSDNRLTEGTTPTWKQDIRENGVLPYRSALDLDQLTVDASWTTGDNVANAADSSTSSATSIPNSVSVTVSYQWLPEAFLRNPITLSSSATMPMSY